MGKRRRAKSGIIGTCAVEGAIRVFNADDRMIASTNPSWLKTAINILTGLLGWVGLEINVRKTVGMVCQLCRAVGIREDKAYKRQMMGEGQSYQERQREQVQCLECGKYLSRRSLDIHQ